jgi:TonB family protein
MGRLTFAALFGLLLMPANPPRCVQHVEVIKYPSLAIQARLIGEVKMSVEVDTEGRVRSADGTNSYEAPVHQLLINAAQANVRNWRFSPGVPETLEVTYTFRLQEQPVEAPQSECTFDLPNRVTVLAKTYPVEVDTAPLNKKGH